MNNKNVLLTSDNKIQLDLLEMFFIKLNCSVTKFLEHDIPNNLVGQRIDLIFISLSKIIHDYYRFLDLIEHENSFNNPYVIVLSEYTLRDLGLKSESVDCYLAKPIIPRVLEQKIIEIFSNQQRK